MCMIIVAAASFVVGAWMGVILTALVAANGRDHDYAEQRKAEPAAGEEDGEMNKYAVSKNIYRCLKLGKMTQKELAQRINVPEPTLSKWMTGQRQPSAYALLRISRVLDVSMEYLMRGVEDE